MTQEFFYVLAHLAEQGDLSHYESETLSPAPITEVDDPRIKVYATAKEIPWRADTKIVKIHRDFLSLDALP